MSRLQRMRAMLGELEAMAERAREHERRMTDALAESRSWSREEDREWIVGAVAEAVVSREDAEARVAEGRLLLARVRQTACGVELGPGRCAIALCRCGSSWPVVVREVRGTLPGVVAHEPGALFCADCRAMTGRLDVTPAPVVDGGEG